MRSNYIHRPPSLYVRGLIKVIYFNLKKKNKTIFCHFNIFLEQESSNGYWKE